MTITVLVCGADGNQHVELREVPDDYFNVPDELIPPTGE